VAWFKLPYAEGAHPVGQKKPNELGLYGMSGNVWEWYQDRYAPKKTGDNVRFAPSAFVREGGHDD